MASNDLTRLRAGHGDCVLPAYAQDEAFRCRAIETARTAGRGEPGRSRKIVFGRARSRSLPMRQAIGPLRQGFIQAVREVLCRALAMVPERSCLAAYRSPVDHRANLRLMDARTERIEGVGLPMFKPPCPASRIERLHPNRGVPI